MCAQDPAPASLQVASQGPLTRDERGGRFKRLSRNRAVPGREQPHESPHRLPSTHRPAERNLRRASVSPKARRGIPTGWLLLRSETQRRESPEGAGDGGRWQLPFLENSTACQKSTPDMLIPRLHAVSRGAWFL